MTRTSERIVTTDAAPAEDSRHSPALALAAVSIGFFMVTLDGSALNVALPSIQRDVHGSLSGLQWVVTAYTIPLASVLLTAGSIGDRLGVRRLFLWSTAAFTLASVACVLSPSLGVLVAARAVQGVAAGGVLPTTLTIVARTYPDPVERARAITVWGGVGGAAIVAGPIVGGVLADAFGWRSIFAINLPVGALVAALAARHVREFATGRAQRLDLPGQLLGVLTLTALVAWLITGGSDGWTNAVPVAFAVVAVLAGGAFVLVERRVSAPMLPFALFRVRAFTASVANGFAFQFAGYGVQFVLALYLQQHWRLDAAQAGLVFAPFGVAWLLGTTALNRLLIHRGMRFVLAWGAATGAAGALGCLAVDGRGTWPIFIGASTVMGAGCGLLAPSLNAAAMRAVDPRHAGLGSGVLNTARQVGMAVGVALLGGVLAGADAVRGLRIDLLLVAGCLAAVVVLSVRYVPSRARA